MTASVLIHSTETNSTNSLLQEILSTRLRIHFVLFKSKQDLNVDLYTDNINVDPLTGMFWLVKISQAADAAVYSANLSHPSSSQVFEVNLGKASTSWVAFPDYEIREVCAIANDGRGQSFATTAFVYQERLLVGTVDNNDVTFSAD